MGVGGDGTNYPGPGGPEGGPGPSFPGFVGPV